MTFTVLGELGIDSRHMASVQHTRQETNSHSVSDNVALTLLSGRRLEEARVGLDLCWRHCIPRRTNCHAVRLLHRIIPEESLDDSLIVCTAAESDEDVTMLCNAQKEYSQQWH